MLTEKNYVNPVFEKNFVIIIHLFQLVKIK